MANQDGNTGRFSASCPSASKVLKHTVHAVTLAALLGTSPILAQPVERNSPPPAVTSFDLARTTQTFSLMGNGGVLDIVSTDGDPGQIASIRSHLRERGQAFARGDIPIPASFPQDSLPDMAELRAGAARVAVVFEELPAGGRLNFTTQDLALLPVLSFWLATTAQKDGAELRIGVPPGARILRETPGK